MGPIWAPSFVASLLVAIISIPFLRRLALATDFVDRPGGHKSHQAAVPYLGGLALIASVLAGLAAGRLGNEATVIALGACVLGTVGLIDDHRTVDPRVRLGLQLVAAILPLALGLRVHITGIAAVDACITAVWIVGITNAFNLLDNMDGLSAGVAAAAAGSVLWLAVAGGADATGTAAAAAAAGACLGFLAYNWRPASIFMGDTGSLFLGFVIAVLAIDVDPPLSPPRSFIIPLLVLALPMLDTATVTVSRLRRGRSVLSGGKDHLSHRLTVLGLSPGTAVAALVGVEVFLGALAVLSGRRIISLWLAAALAVAVLVCLSAGTSRAAVYEEGPRRWPRSLVIGATAGAAGLLALSVLAVSDSPLAEAALPTRLTPSPTIAVISICGTVLVLGATLTAITRQRRDATES